MREAIGDIASVLAEVVVPVAVNGAVAWWLGLAGFLHWYLIAATGSSFAFTLAGVFTNLDEHEGLISPNFMRFSADVEAGLHGLYFGWGPPVQYVRHPPLRPVGRMVEWAVAQGITDVASLLLLAWQFIVAPMVYPLYAVLGAPARVAARSPGATYREGDSWTLTPTDPPCPPGSRSTASLSARSRSPRCLRPSSCGWCYRFCRSSSAVGEACIQMRVHTCGTVASAAEAHGWSVARCVPRASPPCKVWG